MKSTPSGKCLPWAASSCECHHALMIPAAKGKRLWLFIALMVIWLTAATGAHAQTLYGSLTGTVTDPSGAAVVGARVTALAVQTGVRHVTVTNSSGIYQFPNLLAATYTVTVKAPGFAGQTTNDVIVEVNTPVQRNFQLAVGKASQTVTVTTAAPLLQTETATVQTNITNRQIKNLPIFGSQGANPQRLLQTVPGVGLIAETNSLAANPQRAVNAPVNGQSTQAVDTRIDGVLDAYPYLPANVAYVPPADAYSTIQAVTNSYTAQEGMAGGAEVNMNIKSGTNHFHGDVHWSHFDQNFGARNYFQTDKTIFPHKNRNNQNEYGGSIGGPVVKNKLFFFFDFDRTTQRQLAGPDTRTLPTAAMANGDFTALPGNPVIYDPATGDATGNNKTQISCNGVPNKICANRIDPAAETMIKLMAPLFSQETATSNGLLNWTGSGTALFNRNNSDSKVTWIIGPKSMLWGRYSFSKTLVYDPPLLGAAIGDATNGGQLGNAPGLVQQVGIGATHSFTSNLLFDWNFGYTRQRLGSTFDLTSPRGLDQLGIPGTNNAGTTGSPSLYYGWPGFSFSSSYGGDLNIGNSQVANPFLFRDDMFVSDANVTWIKGKHNIKGGFEWSHTLINHFQAQGGIFQNARGQFQFNGFATSQFGSTPSWFNEWADFLLGLPQETGKARQIFNPNAERWGTWGGYLQDQWQVTPKLVMTYGIRWELYPFGYSDNGKGLRWLNLNSGIVSIGGYGGVPRNDGISVGHGQYQPRVGIAYNVNPSTVIRLGYGLSADPYNAWHVLLNSYPSIILDTNLPQNQADYVPAASLTGLNGSNLGGGTYSVPTGIKLIPLPDLSSGSIALPTSASTTTIPNPFHRGYISSYNVTLEQEFGRNAAWTIGYVGDYDSSPITNMNANPSAPGAGSAGGILSKRYGANYTGTINELNPFKFSRYDSLQTSFKYHFAGGSMLNVAYTWSKAMDYADNQDLGGLLIPYAPDYYKDYGPASFDRANNFELSGVMALPFGRDGRWAKNGVAGQVLGGWFIDPIVSIMSGTPFTVSAGGNLNANGSSQTADLVKPFRLTHGKPPRTGTTCALGEASCEYFAPSSFAAPLINSTSPAHFGNTNRDEFRGPGYFSMDVNLQRTFNVRKFASLVLQAEAMNLTNTPHFGNPNTTCPSNATVAGPIGGTGQVCNTGSNNNFGVITGVAQPGGYFGPDPGSRQLWLDLTVDF
ncbi:hypothetical protein ACP_0190 [Acidobacterium capsulatum ATCC 51196]|uniref:TonB-dependent transporter Oar-like beta-barrel domain-containing protein n=2 Tax=Acidobacteriaceae TaxID=204434 RepID=C1F8R1_ACIC5|nr:hypothetical protein ACP_0190 [Acidobacterium capsulatum ATCC 51196]